MRPELREVLISTKLGLEERNKKHKEYISTVNIMMSRLHSHISQLKEVCKSFEGLPLLFKEKNLFQFSECDYSFPEVANINTTKIKRYEKFELNYRFTFNKSEYRIYLFDTCMSYYYHSSNMGNFNTLLDLILSDIKGKTLEATTNIVDWLEDQKFNPEWKTSNVVSLLQTISGEEDTSAYLPLADALQDAGCDNTIILNLAKFGNPQILEWLNEGIKNAS